MKTSIIVLGLIVMAVSPSCQSESVPGEEFTETNGLDSVLILSQEQLDFMDIQIETVSRSLINPVVSSHGTLELTPENKSVLSTVMGGIVRSVRIHQGDVVKKGQVLAYIDSPEFLDLQEDYLIKKNELALLKSAYEREERLSKDQINSKKSLQEAKSSYDEALIQLNMLSSRLKMLNVNLNQLDEGKIIESIPIVSMISGTIDAIHVHLGQFIEPGNVLFEVVNNDHLHAELLVFQKDVQRIKRGQFIQFTTPSIADRSYQGVIFSVGEQIDQETGGLFVHAELDNSDHDLKAGMYLSAEILLDSVEVNTIPSSAIVEDEKGFYVFIEMENGEKGERKFMQKRVWIEELGNEQVSIWYPDLKEQDKIVVRGSYLLMAELNKE